MKRIAIMLGLGAAMFAGVVASDIGVAAASCAAPTIEVSPAQGAPGSVIIVTGSNFVTTCNDTVVNGAQPAPNAPQTGITIVFNQSDRRTPLSTVDATGATGTFTLSVVVPASAQAGAAQIEASQADGPVSRAFTVIARNPELPHTGGMTSRPTLIGLGLLALGWLTLATARRRQSPAA